VQHAESQEANAELNYRENGRLDAEIKWLVTYLDLGVRVKSEP